MLTKNTVLVLGAGASQPFGFPIRSELKNRIVEKDWTDILIQSGLRNELRMGRHESFIKNLDRASCTIDEFVADNSIYLGMAKVMMAHVLLDAEEESNLRSGDWYSYLLSRMKLGKFDDYRLSIITFNYDRSFEQFLYEDILARCNGDIARAKELVSKIRIVHVHGTLAPLDWQGGPFTIPYGNKLNGPFERHDTKMDRLYRTVQAALNASQGIGFIFEENNESLEVARQLLATADQIVFLGCGYHEENMLKLNIDQIDINGKTFLGSTFKMPYAELEGIRRRYPFLQLPSNTTAHQLLTDHFNIFI